MSKTRTLNDFKLGSLTKRSEFLFVRDGRYAARGAIVVQCRENSDHDGIRFGVTATKRIGNAVTRNRAKRRLREIARLILPGHGRNGFDYVLIGRRDETAKRDFAAMCDDLKNALKKVHG